MSDIFQKVIDFVATLSDGDYKVEPARTGAYDVTRSATYITVSKGKLRYAYQDLWCGANEIEGETYRQHRNGKLAKYPKRLDKAKDITEQWKKLFTDGAEDKVSDFEFDFTMGMLFDLIFET